MKKITMCLLLSLLFAIGTNEAYADRHNDRGHDRKEQRYNGRKPNNKDHKFDKKGDKGNKYKRDDRHDKGYKSHKNDRHDYGKKDYNHKKGHSMPSPGYGMRNPAPRHVSHYAPAPRRHHHGPVPPPRLSHMVKYATRGCRDVAVWQINPDTYIVKYRRGNRYYTQYLYPYEEMYGDCSLITVNWQPLSPWTLIPPIQLNINI